MRFLLRDLYVIGSTIYGEYGVRPRCAGLVGREVSLQDIYDLARLITAKYGDDGHALSRAIDPVLALQLFLEHSLNCSGDV